MFAASVKNGRPAGAPNIMCPRGSLPGTRGNAVESWAIAILPKSHRDFEKETYGTKIHYPAKKLHDLEKDSVVCSAWQAVEKIFQGGMVGCAAVSGRTGLLCP
jgi:hypothetical protein